MSNTNGVKILTVAILAVATLLALSIITYINLQPNTLGRQNISKEVLKDDIHINMGSVSFRIQQSANTPLKSLEGYMRSQAKEDIRKGCSDVYYTVKKYNSDETQTLLSYGCDSPDASMYAVYKDNMWEFITPTNKFDELGIPDCSYVAEYQISNDIAPVCQSHDSSLQKTVYQVTG